MEVKIIPISGCVQVILAVFTLGIAPLAKWLGERNWPKFVDEQGLVTRGENRIPWNEFTKVTKVVTRIGNTSGTTEHYELRHPKGKVIVAEYRLVNGNQIMNYIWQRLPEQAKKAQ